ncbi:MAG TPA: hypothetical protein VGO24_09180 [Solirubrobacterales bacterium]|nr:hypothetical protein [Solirubrobacterales bacterium]
MKRVTLVAGLATLLCALSLASASSASALSIGLSWSGNIAESDSPSEWDIIQHSGASIYRMSLSWAEWNESGPGVYDEAFRLAAERGITILPDLGDRASRKAPQGFPRPGEPEYEQWYLWVKQVVKRYGLSGNFWVGKPFYKPVPTWEVWNEPNLVINNPENKVQPVNYGNFLVYTSAAIHSAQAEQQPGAVPQVLMGGLYQAPVGAPNMAYNTFLGKVYEASGVSTSYDGLSIHPYGFDSSHTTGNKTIAETTGEITAVRAQLNGLPGGSGKALWITELGWPMEFEHPVFNQAEQARLLRQSFEWVKANAAADNIQSLIWYNARDWPLAAHWAYSCGLRDRYGNYRQSWTTFQEQTGAFPWPQQMLLDGGGQVWATAGVVGGAWTQQTPPGETAISAGDNLEMLLDGGGQIWAKTGIAGGWGQETWAPMKAIAAGGNGLQMLLDPGGTVYVQQGIGTAWVAETAPGMKKIAAGGNGLQMLIDPGGEVYATTGGGTWTRETPGMSVQAISAGDSGLQMILDTSGQVWARTGIGATWTLESPPGEVAIAAGGGVQMILDASGQVWAKSSENISYGSWTPETPAGETAIAAGGGGLQMILDGGGQVWAKTSIGNGNWTPETPAGETAIAAGG